MTELCQPRRTFLSSGPHRSVSCVSVWSQLSVGSGACALTPLSFSLISFSKPTAKKRIHYNEGGQAGNREGKINNLIQRMN